MWIQLLHETLRPTRFEIASQSSSSSLWVAHNRSDVVPRSLQRTQRSLSPTSHIRANLSLRQHHQTGISICKYQQCSTETRSSFSPLLTKQLLVPNLNNKMRSRSGWAAWFLGNPGFSLGLKETEWGETQTHPHSVVAILMSNTVFDLWSAYKLRLD